MPITRYHCSVDLRAILNCDEFALAALRTYDASATDAPQIELLARATIMQAKGRNAWPLCDNHDASGRCKGHPK